MNLNQARKSEKTKKADIRYQKHPLFMFSTLYSPPISLNFDNTSPPNYNLEVHNAS